jgi:hypothetical protein
MKIYKNTLILISEGEYSDYGVSAALKATDDINMDDIKKEFEQLKEDALKSWRIDADISTGGFVNWLVNIKKVAEELDYTEVHTGSYKFNLTALDKNGILKFGEQE